MKLIPAIVLCGIVALTSAEDQCSCDSLKKCVDEQKATMKATFKECGQMCRAELGGTAADVGKCFENISTQMGKFEQTMESCMFDPANNICGSERVKRDFMFRKHHGSHSNESDVEERDSEETEEWEDRESKHHKRPDKGHKKHGSKSESDEERDDEESNESEDRKHGGKEGKHGKHGGHREKHGDKGKCGHKRPHHENLLNMKMEPFQECMQQCFRAKHEKPHEQSKEHEKEWKMEESRSHEAEYERPHHRRGHHAGGWWMKKCEKKLNCTINKEAVKTTMETCLAKSGVTKANAFEFKLQSCECVRDAFKIEPWQSPCAKSMEKGFHHHWNGGDENVHHGSHFN